MRERQSGQGLTGWRWGRFGFGQDGALPILGQELPDDLEQLPVVGALASQEHICSSGDRSTAARNISAARA